MYSHNPQIHGSCHPLLFPVPPHNEGHPSGEVLATLASTFLRLLANLGKFSCLGGRPAQALQQAGFPQSGPGWLRPRISLGFSYTHTFGTGALGTPHARLVHPVHEQFQPASNLWWVRSPHQAWDQRNCLHWINHQVDNSHPGS